MNIKSVSDFGAGKGFVIHGDSNGRQVSGWFDDLGTLLDSEKLDCRNRSRKPARADLGDLETFGRLISKHKAAGEDINDGP